MGVKVRERCLRQSLTTAETERAGFAAPPSLKDYPLIGFRMLTTYPD